MLVVTVTVTFTKVLPFIDNIIRLHLRKEINVLSTHESL